MKSPAYSLLRITILIVIISLANNLSAATPPDPGGDPTGGGPPVGGGAPVDNGTVILMVAALGYASYKTRKLWFSKNPT